MRESRSDRHVRHSAARRRPGSRPDRRSRPVGRRQHLAVANPCLTQRQTWPQLLRRLRRLPCDPHRHSGSAARQVRPAVLRSGSHWRGHFAALRDHPGVLRLRPGPRVRPAEQRLRPARRDHLAVRRARPAEGRRVRLAPQSRRLADRRHSVERRQYPAERRQRRASMRFLDRPTVPVEQQHPAVRRLRPDQRGHFAVRREGSAVRCRRVGWRQRLAERWWGPAGAEPRRTELLRAGSPPMTRRSRALKQMHPSPAVRRGRPAAQHRRRCRVVRRDPARWQRFARRDRPAARRRIVERTRHRAAQGSRSARSRNPAARQRSVRRIECPHRRRAPTGQHFRPQRRFARCRPRQERPIEWQRFRSRRSWTLPQWPRLAERRWRGCLRRWRGSECPAERRERRAGRRRFRVCPAERMWGLSQRLLRGSCQPSRCAGFPWLPRRLR